MRYVRYINTHSFLKCTVFHFSFLHVRESCLAAHASALRVTRTRTTHALTFSIRTNKRERLCHTMQSFGQKNEYCDDCTQDLARANVS